MKKYTDWQNYVKEQTDKLNRLRQERGDQDPPRKQVPVIDNDRFVIHKKEPAASPSPATRDSNTRGSQQAPEDREPRKPFSNAPRQAAAEEPAASPIASPFVSVQDVWKSAEKTARKKPAQRKDNEISEASRVRAARLPEINKIKPRHLDAAEQRQVAREESREEILDRLMNPTITLEEAAKIMGVCKATVRRYTSMGILPHYRTPGNQRRFKLSDIIQFLENQRR
jgi:excisionase family DNA binding protein